MLRLHQLGKFLMQTDAQDIRDILGHAADKAWAQDYSSMLHKLVGVVNAVSDLRDDQVRTAQRELGLAVTAHKIYPQRAQLSRVASLHQEVPVSEPSPPLQALPLLLLYDLTLNHLLTKYAPIAKKECDKAYAYHQDPRFKADCASLLLGAELLAEKQVPAFPLRGVYTGCQPDGKALHIQGTDILDLPRGDVGWVAVGKQSPEGLIAAHTSLLSKDDYALMAGILLAKKTLLTRLDLTHTATGLDGKPFTYDNWWERIIHTYSNADLDTQSRLVSYIQAQFEPEMSSGNHRGIRLLNSAINVAFNSGRGSPRYPETEAFTYALEAVRGHEKALNYAHDRGFPTTESALSPHRALERLFADGFKPSRSLTLMLEEQEHTLQELQPLTGTLSADFSKKIVGLHHRLSNLQPSSQLSGFADIWRSNLDLLPDLGVDLRRCYGDIQRFSSSQPNLLSDFEQQFDAIQVAFESSWKMNRRGQKLTHSMLNLLKVTLPTFYNFFDRSRAALQGETRSIASMEGL